MRGVYTTPNKKPPREYGSSPHARGLQEAPGVPKPGRRIIPACAGFTKWARAGRSPNRDHPRMRGVYSTITKLFLTRGGSSPHARGLPRISRVLHRPIGIIPACAGFTACCGRVPDSGRDHPRMRGVYMSTGPFTESASGSSPHARGLLTRDIVIPSRAPDHPRMRGVYLLGLAGPGFQLGSSPHARGLLPHEKLRVIYTGIIPACAGFTHHRGDGSPRSQDHPRMRGVYRYFL